MAARCRGGSVEGFFVAAKGGHNAESHNHNDVGNFILYADGHPVLIDVGVETYTARTFSSRRYEIWTMQSAYHNLPTVNGEMQREGSSYRAADVRYRSDESRAEFELDLAGAYPAEAALESWRRRITLSRGREVTIQDRFVLREVRAPIQVTLMSWKRPKPVEPGIIQLAVPGAGAGSAPVQILYDAALFRMVSEEIPVEDGRLRSSWGDRVYRMLFTAQKALPEGTFGLRVGRSTNDLQARTLRTEKGGAPSLTMNPFMRSAVSRGLRFIRKPFFLVFGR
jgi:hypothetical protein